MPKPDMRRSGAPPVQVPKERPRKREKAVKPKESAFGTVAGPPPMEHVPKQTDRAVVEISETVDVSSEDDAATTEPEDNDLDIYKIMYAYCGESRKGDIKECLDELAKKHKVKIVVEEIDLCRGGEVHDLTVDSIVDKLVLSLEESKFDAAIITPPCNTHSRALFANKWGPRPYRSRNHPMGFPWLEGAAKAKIETANKLIEVAFKLAEAAYKGNTPYVIEHPEDLVRQCWVTRRAFGS